MKKMKKSFVLILSVLLIISVIAGCAAKSGRNTSAATAPSSPSMADMAGTTSNGNKVSVSFSEEKSKTSAMPAEPKMEPESQGIRGTGYEGSSASYTSSQTTNFDILAQRKIIRNANLSLEVDDFYNSYGNLQAMLNGIGFVQESNIHRDFYTYEGERKTRVSGDITIRVDARHFDNILNDIKGLGEVIDDRIYSTDVTDQFFDTEGRLKVLKIEYDYLEEYMRSLKDPDSIFKTRMRMTELQTQIEQLTGTLNKWSDLVELSTIYIQMNEKYPEEVTKVKTNTYWDRLKNAIGNSLTGIVDAIGDLIIFVIEAIPTLVILGIIGLIIYRVVKKFIRRKQAPPAEAKKE